MDDSHKIAAAFVKMFEGMAAMQPLLEEGPFKDGMESTINTARKTYDN